MFRTKGLSILQNIANRSLYDIAHINLLSNTLFSTDASHGDSAKASNNVSDVNLSKNVIQAKDLFENSNKTSENLNHDATVSPGIVKNDSNESSFTSSTVSEEDEIDKLYQKVALEVRGNDPVVLKSYGQFAVMAAQHLDITVGKNFAPKKPIHERLTVLKSIHVHKKHRVQYETRTYYRYLDFFRLTGSTADTFLEYIERNLPEGVAMKVTKVELQTLPPTVQQAAPP